MVEEQKPFNEGDFEKGKIKEGQEYQSGRKYVLPFQAEDVLDEKNILKSNEAVKKFTEVEEFDEVREEEDAMENIKNDDNDVEENIKKA